MINHFIKAFCISLFFISSLSAQDKVTLSGYITDINTGEGLIGASVVDLRSGKGTVTNTYGFYSLTMEGDSAFVAASYIGYKTQILPLFLSDDKTIDIKLDDQTTLETVEIVAEKSEKIEEKTEMSTISVPVKQLKRIPALLGETDILKAIQLLPGVQSGGEGQSGFYVRGGSQDQNLILLDGTPVYNASHLFGFFSVFNADAIKDVTLIKGGFPARYGGRLSSVLDITMKEGNNQEFKANGSIGIISSKLTLEGPIVKDKGSYIISGRRTYVDILARPFIALAFASEGGTSGSFGYYFYDLNAKVNWKFNSKDRVYLSAYSGDDLFYTRLKESYSENDFRSDSEIDLGLGWGNLTSTFRWNHLYTDKLFSNLSLTYSKYNFGTRNGFSEESFLNDVQDSKSEVSFGYDSGIRDWALKMDFDYIPASNHFIRFGANATLHDFYPGENEIYFEFEEDGDNFLLDTIFGQEDVRAIESYLYVEDDIQITERLKANVGIHYSNFAVRNKTFQSFQPRISARYLFPQSISLKASFATMQQNIQYLTNENLGLPWDQWLPTTDQVVPQTSWQAAAGLAKTFNNQYEVSIEGYYKYMNNVTSYREGASVFQSTDWQNQVTQGEGRSYGVELFLQKKTGRLSGWLGYTLSWSERRFDDKNFGNWYPFVFDRRHDLSIVAVYDITDRWSMSAAFVYGTGNAFTFPNSQYFIIEDFGDFFYPQSVDAINERNNYRMNPYHRADVNFDYTWGKKRWKHKISFGAYNMYNRKNPFFINPETEFEYDPVTGESTSRNVLVQYSLFRLIPSLAYSFSF